MRTLLQAGAIATILVAPAHAGQPGPVAEHLAPVLMQAIWGGNYDAAQAKAHVFIKGHDAGRYTLMTFLSAASLPDGRTAVVVNGSPSDEHKHDPQTHASAGMLNFFILSNARAGWHVVERKENVTQLGAYGNIGQVQWVELGSGQPGFILSSENWGGGEEETEAVIFGLSGGLRRLGGFRTQASNIAACTPQRKQCRDVSSTMRFADGRSGTAYHDIAVTFKDRRIKLAEDETTEIPLSTSLSTAWYRFDGNQYKLLSGANPIPGD